MNRRIRTLQACLSICIAAALAQDAPASERCRKAKGHLVDQEQFTGAGCSAPPGLFCVRGEATGTLRGRFVSTTTSVTPSVDTPQTAVVFLTADLVLQTRHGQLTIKEAIAYNTAPGGGEFGDLGTVVAGTGKWAGASGRLIISGRLNFVDPSDVDYEGEICAP